jgi:hypothetical protein
MSNQPVHRTRVSNVSVAIWRNVNDNGTFYNISAPQRGYQNSDDAWRNTDALGADDIQNAIKAMNMAHDWIIAQVEADRKARKDAATANAA